jgi:hypothetical protein
MTKPFPPTVDFHALALLDLLEAREAYHVHLAHLENVVATAVGLYRIRNSEVAAQGPAQAAQPKPANPSAEPRTLANSQVVAGMSWPCVLVFVKRWQRLDDFRRAPDEVVPKRLYLPDGRMVPVCVVLAEPQEASADTPELPRLPGGVLGGGYPVFADVQGQQHVGSLGCLVTDGSVTYALTNRHVTGEEGLPSYALVRGERVDVGKADARQAGKLPFADVYPGWPGTRSFCNMDAGLIRLDDLDSWTAQVYGIGEIGEPVDLNVDTLSLSLIGTPVRAFGGAAGPLVGEVQGLFYRYRSVGGFDYVADLLIGPRPGNTPVATRHGDSGTLWFYDPPPPKEDLEAGAHEPEQGLRAPRLRPLALQWGGHQLLGTAGEQRMQFALATCVSTVCRVLDVELVRDWNIGLSEYWGKVGHYKIAAKACELPADDRLRKLLMANQDRIAFGDKAITAGGLATDSHAFVPLADVADIVWRTTRPDDESNHFADMDLPPKDGPFKGRSLLDLSKDPANVTPSVWNRYYASIGEDKKRGALPFRVWQMYDDMVRFLKAGDVLRFVCAGGLMSHYVGDACQPLHVSHLHHGRDPSEKAVHGDYETKMLDRFAADLVGRVNGRLDGKHADADVRGGQAAAVSVVGLMRSTIDHLPPLEVVQTWAAAAGRNRIATLWQALGDKTADCIASGCLRLAALWQSAWREGGGAKVPDARLVALDPDELRALYRDPKFVPSLTLEAVETTGLLSGAAPGDGGNGRPTRTRRQPARKPARQPARKPRRKPAR